MRAPDGRLRRVRTQMGMACNARIIAARASVAGPPASIGSLPEFAVTNAPAGQRSLRLTGSKGDHPSGNGARIGFRIPSKGQSKASLSTHLGRLRKGRASLCRIGQSVSAWPPSTARPLSLISEGRRREWAWGIGVFPPYLRERGVHVIVTRPPVAAEDLGNVLMGCEYPLLMSTRLSARCPDATGNLMQI